MWKQESLINQSRHCLVSKKNKMPLISNCSSSKCIKMQDCPWDSIAPAPLQPGATAAPCPVFRQKLWKTGEFYGKCMETYNSFMGFSAWKHWILIFWYIWDEISPSKMRISAKLVGYGFQNGGKATRDDNVHGKVMINQSGFGRPDFQLDPKWWFIP